MRIPILQELQMSHTSLSMLSLVLLGVLLATAQPVSAGCNTTVERIMPSEVWDSSGSPYCIIGLVDASGAQVTVGSGTTVRILEDSEEGELGSLLNVRDFSMIGFPGFESLLEVGNVTITVAHSLDIENGSIGMALDGSGSAFLQGSEQLDANDVRIEGSLAVGLGFGEPANRVIVTGSAFWTEVEVVGAEVEIETESPVSITGGSIELLRLLDSSPTVTGVEFPLTKPLQLFDGSSVDGFSGNRFVPGSHAEFGGHRSFPLVIDSNTTLRPLGVSEGPWQPLVQYRATSQIIVDATGLHTGSLTVGSRAKLQLKYRPSVAEPWQILVDGVMTIEPEAEVTFSSDTSWIEVAGTFNADRARFTADPDDNANEFGLRFLQLAQGSIVESEFVRLFGEVPVTVDTRSPDVTVNHSFLEAFLVRALGAPGEVNDFTENCWDTRKPMEIGKKIYDVNDSPGLATIDFRPFDPCGQIVYLAFDEVVPFRLQVFCECQDGDETLCPTEYDEDENDGEEHLVSVPGPGGIFEGPMFESIPAAQPCGSTPEQCTPSVLTNDSGVMKQTILNGARAVFEGSDVTQVEFVDTRPQEETPYATVWFPEWSLNDIGGANGCELGGIPLTTCQPDFTKTFPYDLGPDTACVLGFADVDRFNRLSTGDAFIFHDPGDVQETIAKIAHEVGHLLGLIHVKPIDPGLNSVMDSCGNLNKRFSNTNSVYCESQGCNPAGGDGCPIADLRPPLDHNPRYHIQRHTEKRRPEELGIPGLYDVPGAVSSGALSLIFPPGKEAVSGAAVTLHEVRVYVKAGGESFQLWDSVESLATDGSDSLQLQLPIMADVFVRAASVAGGAQDVVLASGDPYVDSLTFQVQDGNVAGWFQQILPGGGFSTIAAVEIGIEVSIAGRVPAVGEVDPPLLIDREDENTLRLTWSASCQAGDADYAIYEGTLGDFESHDPKSCTTGGALQSNVVADAGDRYFLVVPNDGTVEGSYGLASGPEERPASEQSCLARATVYSCTATP